MVESEYLSLENLESLRNYLHEFYETELPTLVEDLTEYAGELDAANKAIQISKVSGSATSIAGAILGTVGFALSFATFGASLGLSVAGAVIAGAGGLTVGGATIADAVKSSKTRKKAEEHLKKCEKVQEDINKVFLKLENNMTLNERLPRSERKLGQGVCQAGVGLGYGVVAKPIIVGANLAKAADIASDATMPAMTAFRTLSNVGKGFHIAGGVVGVVLLPLDIYTLVSSSISISKRAPHELSEKLRVNVAQIKSSWLSKEEIDKMIDEAIDVMIQNMNTQPSK